MFGLSAAPRELARSSHSTFGDALQHRILGHRHHILEFGLGIQKLEHGRMREPAIQAYPNPHSGKMATNPLHQTLQNATAPLAAVTLPGRNTAAQRYCSASSLKLTKPITGR